MIDVFYIGLDDPFGFSANNPKKASSLSCDVAATPMLQGSFNLRFQFHPWTHWIPRCVVPHRCRNGQLAVP